MRSFEIHLRAVSEWVFKPLVWLMTLEIIFSKLAPYFLDGSDIDKYFWEIHHVLEIPLYFQYNCLTVFNSPVNKDLVGS